MTRRRLLDAARALRDNGTIPPLVDDPSVSYGARSGDLIAPEGQPWLEAYEETLRQALHPDDAPGGRMRARMYERVAEFAKYVS